MPTIIKAIMLGNRGVGKTSILLKFIQGIFNQNHQCTVGVDFNSYEFQYNSKEYLLQIWDTAGQQRYRAITKTYFKSTSIVFLTVSATDGVEHNLSQIREILKFYFEHAQVRYINIFINKTDLVDLNSLEADWKNKSQQVKELKEKYRIRNFYFVSAKTTNLNQFREYIKQACIMCVGEEEVQETIPSAIHHKQSVSLSPVRKKKTSRKEIKKDDNINRCCS